MALFTIFAPNILSYIKKSFHLHTPTCLDKQSLDRPNITQMVNTITKPGFEDLDFLISKTGFISKTIVFVDKIDDAIALAAHLWSLLLLEQRN